MKDDLVKIGLGLFIGILLATLFRGCGDNRPMRKTSTEVVVEYKTKVVEVPTGRIEYLPGEVKDTTIYKTKYEYDTIVDTDTIFKEVIVPIYTNVYIKPFSFSDSSVAVSGVANIVADNLHSFKLDSLKFKYTEKNTTITNTIYKNNHNLYLGASLGFDRTSLRSTGFGLYYGNNKLLLGAGLDYHFNTSDLSYKALVGLRLFNKNKTK